MLDRLFDLDAGGVDENIKLAALLVHARHGRACFVFRGDIEPDEAAAIRGIRQCSLLRQIRREDRCAFTQEPRANRSADPAAPTGYERNLSRQHVVQSLVPRPDLDCLIGRACIGIENETVKMMQRMLGFS